MLTKQQVKNALQNEHEREQALKRQLKWYFWNLQQYRKGGIICDCDRIVPVNKVCECGKMPLHLIKNMVCKQCSKNFVSYREKVFCSPKCLEKWGKEKSTNVCAQCNHYFLRPNSASRYLNRFCTQKCYRKYRSLNDSMYKGDN